MNTCFSGISIIEQSALRKGNWLEFENFLPDIISTMYEQGGKFGYHCCE